MSELVQRRVEEKADRRRQIVDAAEQLYAEVGWDRLTIDQVARRARLSRALIYLYFKDKKDLLGAIRERAVALLTRRFHEAVARHRLGGQKIEAIGRAYIAYAQEVPHYFDAIARCEIDAEAVAEPATITAEPKGGHDDAHSLMVRVLREGQQDGSITEQLGDLDAAAVALWAFTHGVIQIHQSRGDELTRVGIDSSKLLKQAFSMLNRALAGPGST